MYDCTGDVVAYLVEKGNRVLSALEYFECPRMIAFLFGGGGGGGGVGGQEPLLGTNFIKTKKTLRACT